MRKPAPDRLLPLAAAVIGAADACFLAAPGRLRPTRPDTPDPAQRPLAGEARASAAARRTRTQRAGGRRRGPEPGAPRPESGRAICCCCAGRDFPSAPACPRPERLSSETRPASAAPGALALPGDTLWAFGLFEEAERAYETALRRQHRRRAAAITAAPASDRPRPPRRRSAGRSAEALKLAPRDSEFHHTVGDHLRAPAPLRQAAAAFVQLRQPPAEPRSTARRRTGPAPRSASSTPSGADAGRHRGRPTAQIWTVAIRIDGER